MPCNRRELHDSGLARTQIRADRAFLIGAELGPGLERAKAVSAMRILNARAPERSLAPALNIALILAIISKYETALLSNRCCAKQIPERL
jgi:hypothetical protein